jgi:hypothetical protein
MDNEILKADPRYRKKALISMLVMVIFGIMAIVFLLPWLKGYLMFLGCRKGAQVLVLIFGVAFIIPIFLSIQMLRIAAKSMREERFPPSGTKVIKDTAVLSGNAAKNRGIILFFLAGFMLLVSIIGIALVLHIMVRFV